jgi:hypothetical protein
LVLLTPGVWLAIDSKGTVRVTPMEPQVSTMSPDRLWAFGRD